MLKTLQAPGMNDAVELSFYPVGGFSNADINKTVSCKDHGVDANCTGDIYESCILTQFCGGVSCPAAYQLELVAFLHCFETLHDANLTFADSCAEGAGLDVSKIHECFDDPVASQAAFQVVLDGAAAVIPTMHCFPWVELEGTVISTSYDVGCLGENAGTYPLVQTLCNATASANVRAPAACQSATTLLA